MPPQINWAMSRHLLIVKSYTCLSIDETIGAAISFFDSRLFAADFSFICVYQRSSAAELLWPIAICAICQLLAAFSGNISPQ